ncbi:MAG: NADH-quinone oxidoreductase subunit L [Verrucomicrobia bacterium]|nr:MAG: NADH-quinone oxidoreductase subunit L [Verrucomicrobiota bacterium]
MLTNGQLVWLILFAPLLAAGAIMLFTRRLPRVSAALSIGAVMLGFALSLKLFVAVLQSQPVVAPSVVWLDLAGWPLVWAATVDRLSALMLLVVTGVGATIHVYSLGYMRGDAGFARFFGCLSLFMFSMLGIVLAANFIQMFIFWELVGVSSYLLIGFWFERPSAAEAGKKAFIVNRIGDFGFLLGILLIGAVAGTFNFGELETKWPTLGLSAGTLALAAGLIFCGAVGKSAQFPLHVWLPDAMEGPTPVSALIHAATMVAAGVYMLCRVAWLLAASPEIMNLIAWTGGITALMAASIAVAQRDIKRILAYSTLSQLGYMVMAVGLGATTEAMFHLTTHAFFKALLFLGAGSVIIALHHEQDIFKMGGLARKMLVTFSTFLIGTLALGGVWPLSGFYSKDAILLAEMDANRPLLVLALVTAGLTGFYMARALIVAFLGKARDEKVAGHAHESPLVVTLPLILLAVMAVVAGWHEEIPHFLKPEFHEHEHGVGVLLGFLAIPLAGFALAALLYGRGVADDAKLRSLLGPLYTLLENKFYVDEFYLFLVNRVQGGLAALCEGLDFVFVRGIGVGGVSGITRFAGWCVRQLQGGYLRFYLLFTIIGIVAVLIWIGK